MNPELIVALISGVAALISIALSIYGQNRIATLQARLSREESERSKAVKAEEILSKYREPLVHAAFELQSRLYNILKKNSLGRFYLNGTDRERDYIVENTLYVIAQYFGWTEVIRREIQFLNLGEADATRKLAQLQENIAAMFLADRYGESFRIFRGEQRALGERMLLPDSDDHSVLGYASFVEMKEQGFQRWFEGLRQDIDALSKDVAKHSARLTQIQHALIDLIEHLDPQRIRFSAKYCLKA